MKIDWVKYEDWDGLRGFLGVFPLFNIFYRKGNLFESSYYELELVGGFWSKDPKHWLNLQDSTIAKNEDIEILKSIAQKYFNNNSNTEEDCI